VSLECKLSSGPLLIRMISLLQTYVEHGLGVAFEIEPC
jgi:hypothetical protein